MGVKSKREAVNRAKELGLLGGAAVSATADTAAADSLAATSRTRPAEPPEIPEPGESPFRGLRHFDEADAAWFFGREALAARLVARLVSPASAGAKGPTRFLAVVGASGSGKSSIVRAGVIPALRRTDGTASHFAPIHLITPTTHPLEALAVGLTRQGESVTATATLMDDLARDERALHLYARRLMGMQNMGVQLPANLPPELPGVGIQAQARPWAASPGVNAPTAQAQVNAQTPAGSPPAQSRLLLVVDQFEELFTLCRGEPERQAFINNLLRAAAPETDGPVTVLITLRADFYPHCAAYAGLREALANQQEYIGPMSADELRQAVERPARLGGWEFEPGLVDQILRDVSDDPGALPLLSHALLETWRNRRGRTLTLRSYAKAGRVQGAIATTAEAVYQSMPPEQQAIARGVFLRLTELGDGTQDTRRRVALAELLPAGQADEVARGAVAAVLQTLSEARLITQDEGSVKVAHEALIREWPTLRQWLNEDRDGLRVHRRLTEAAQEWDELERDPSELYRGPRLAQAVEWAEWSTRGEELNALELEFLQASQAWAEHEAAQHEAQQQRELEAARGLAEAQRQRAEAETHRAAEQAQVAGRLRARNRVITAVGVLALLAAIAAGFFGLESNRNVGVAQVANTQSAQNLSAAQAASTQASIQRDEAQRQANLAYGNQLAAQASVVLPSNYTLALLLAAEANRMAGDYLTGYLLHSALIYSPHLLGFLFGHTDSVTSVAFSPDGTSLASASTDQTIRFWDVATHQPAGAPIRLPSFYTPSLAFSPDGKTLAVGAQDGSLRLWDVATRQPVGDPFTGGPASVTSLAFSPDGKTLAAAGGNDITIHLWNVATGQPLGQPLAGHTEYITGVTFSPDGKTLASSSLDGSVRLWDVLTGRQLGEPLIDDGKAVARVAYSPVGHTLASVSMYDVLLRDMATHQPAAPPALLARLSGHTLDVTSVAFSTDGKLLASGSADATLRLWTVANMQPAGAPLVGDNGPINDVAVSPDGKTLASAGANQTVVLWQVSASLQDLALQDPTERACRIAGRNLTRAEWNLYLTGQPYRKTCEQWPEGN